MRKKVSSAYPNTEMWAEKRGAAEIFFNPLRSDWIPDETLFGVFDTASQTGH